MPRLLLLQVGRMKNLSTSEGKKIEAVKNQESMPIVEVVTKLTERNESFLFHVFYSSRSGYRFFHIHCL